MADQDYYRRMLDEDRQEEMVHNRDVKNKAADILQETGYSSPESELYDDANYISPFDDKIDIDMPYIRAKEQNDFGAGRSNNTNEKIPPIEPIKSAAQDSLRNPSSVPYAPGPIEKSIGDVLQPPELSGLPLTKYPGAGGTIVPSQTISPKVSRATRTSGAGVANVGSTAPRDITTNEISKETRALNQGLADQMSLVPEYLQNSESAIRSKAQAEQEGQTLRAETYESQAQDLINEAEEQKAQLASARAQADKLSSQLADRIDPNSVWDNHSTWSKIALVVGAALQGRAGSDTGLKMIDSIATRELQAQLDDRNKGIIKHGNLLDYISKGTKNQAEIMNKGREFTMKMVDAYAKARSAGATEEAAKILATKQTAKDMFFPVIDRAMQNQKNMLKSSEQEQAWRRDDEKLKLTRFGLMNKDLELKAKEAKLGPDEAKRFVNYGGMAQAASAMERLENREDFDPTKITYAMKQYLAGKGVPGSLGKAESEYMANYARYFSVLRQELTGAAASEKEEARIAQFVSAAPQNQKDALGMFQKLRGDTINLGMNALNNEGKLRMYQNIPESRKYMTNRGAVEDSKSLRGN